MKLISILTILAVFTTFSAFASDHIDGPVTQKHRVADLTDFYAFPTPNKPNHLSLILDTYPLVATTSHFTDKVTYVFMIRQASVAGQKAASAFNTNGEVVINCHVQTPNDIKKHTITCKSTNGLAATSTYNVLENQKIGDNFRLYAGMRSDPFFINSDFFTSVTQKSTIPSHPKNENALSQLNCLSIVIEIDLAKLFPQRKTDMLAAAVAVVTKDSQTASLRILDRIGRPEITNISMASRENETDLRDRYNIDRPFSVQSQALAAYEGVLDKNINYYDALDKKTNWVAVDKQATIKLLAQDYLVLDITKPCSTDSFLEIEKSMIKGAPHTTCGGRKPTDDISDTLYTLYIAGLDGARVKDGVDAPTKSISNKFPYLNEPDLDFGSRTKAFIARQALGLAD